MANINELQTLLDYSQLPLTPLQQDGNPIFNVVGFESDGFPANYWTSTAVSVLPDGPGGYVFTLSIGVGWVERWDFLGESRFYVWPVRDMQW